MKCSRTHKSGFTLIEILVAMAIFGLVIAAIYSTWILIIRGSKTGLEAAAQAQRERMAVRTVEEALFAVRSFAADLDHYTFVVDKGAESTLSFVAKLPTSFPRSGKFGDFDVRRITFSTENGSEGGRDLVMRQCPILMDMDKDEQEHPLVLAHNVKDFDIQVREKPSSDRTDTWDLTNQIPAEIMVTLSFSPPNQNGSFGKARDTITRVVVPVATGVPSSWQVPGGQRGPTRPGAIRPGQLDPNQNNPNSQNPGVVTPQ